MDRGKRKSLTICGLAVHLALLMPCHGAAVASRVENLYRAQAIVTGQGGESRDIGLAEALEDVLVKVSGDPRLTDEPRVAVLADKAPMFVDAFRYRDRMAGIPVHDEQGTRDRPYDLIADFNPAKVDAALRSLGRAPWTGPRPRLAVFLGVRIGGAEYVLASDGDRGRDQRDALAAEADRLGMPTMLPSEAALTEGNLTVETLFTAEPAHLDAIARAVGGDSALVGRLTWSDEALGWLSDWRLAENGESHSWRNSGGSFDQAFHKGIGGAARILSGNGEPN
jgi:hypothetical protein